MQQQVSYKTARYFCESFNHEKILFTMLLNGCSGVFPSYCLRTAALTRNPMLLLPDGIFEGNTSTTNFNLLINCLCEISQTENGKCTVIK